MQEVKPQLSDKAFDFVDEVCQEIGRRAEDDGIETLLEPERVASDVWRASGILCSGGFRHFYEGATNMAQVASSFDRLGLHRAAEACRKSLEIFPNGVPPDDDDERFEIIDSVQESRCEFFPSLDDVILDTWDDNLEAILAVFIQANMSEFSGFGPQDKTAFRFKEALARWHASLETQDE